MCCKLLGITDLEKPAARWCPHCRIGVGCGIYEARPHVCRTYACVWRTWREAGAPVEDDLRPDRCHVVIDMSNDGTTHFLRMDPSRPDAWKAQNIQKVAKGLVQHTRLALVVGEKLTWLKAISWCASCSPHRSIFRPYLKPLAGIQIFNGAK